VAILVFWKTAATESKQFVRKIWKKDFFKNIFLTLTSINFTNKTGAILHVTILVFREYNSNRKLYIFLSQAEKQEDSKVTWELKTRKYDRKPTVTAPRPVYNSSIGQSLVVAKIFKF